MKGNDNDIYKACSTHIFSAEKHNAVCSDNEDEIQPGEFNRINTMSMYRNNPKLLKIWLNLALLLCHAYSEHKPDRFSGLWEWGDSSRWVLHREAKLQMITSRNNPQLSKRRINLSLIFCLGTVENTTVCSDTEDEEVVQPCEFFIRINHKWVWAQTIQDMIKSWPVYVFFWPQWRERGSVFLRVRMRRKRFQWVSSYQSGNIPDSFCVKKDI